jgi:hypothetical protein
MLEKNEIRNIIAVLAIILVVIAIYMLPSQTQQETIPENGEQDTLIKQPQINIREVASVVTASKPEQAIMRFAAKSQADKEGTELTIYNQNIALVKEFRSLPLKSGLNLVKYEDIAALIKPDTVLFSDLTDPNAFVVEQNYEYDIVNLEKILEKYLDKVITVYAKDGNIFTGRLLSYKNNTIVLESEGKIIALNEVARFEFPELPEGLLTKPTLVWKLYTENEGVHKTQTSYLTEGITWEASYVANVSADESNAELTGWVTIKNNSGTSYPNTSLKLIAGELNIVKPTERYYKYAYEEMAVPTPSAKQFTEEALFEYHMYTLERKTDIKNNETKQISLLKATDIPLKKEYVFEDTSYYYWRKNTSEKVKVVVSFNNSEANNLGIPLPKGIVRVYKEDSQGKLQFIGEDSIEHTPKDEKVRLFLGYAFDIVAEKKTTSDEKVGDKCRKKSYEVSIRNHKDENIVVTVVQKAYGESNVISSSHEYEKKDAYTFEFKVPVEANSDATLTYTIMSCW